MYSRGFGAPADVKIPEKYDGTALREINDEVDTPPQIQIPSFSDSPKREIKISPSENHEIITEEEPPVLNTKEEATQKEAFTFAPMKWLSDRIPEGLKSINPLPKIELEDLIIIGLFAFLFFSKSGDKECALMILSLLFIS